MSSVGPKLVLDGAAAALDFYRDVLGADVVSCFTSGDSVVFAEIEVLGSRVTLKDADGTDPVAQPGPILDVLHDDPDGVAARLLEAGASEVFAMSDQPWGGRWGRVRDPWGVQWLLQSPSEASYEEIQAVVDRM